LDDAHNHTQVIHGALLNLHDTMLEFQKMLTQSSQGLQLLRSSVNQTDGLIAQNNAKLAEHGGNIDNLTERSVISSFVGMMLVVVLEKLTGNQSLAVFAAVFVVSTYAFLKHATRDPLNAIQMVWNYDKLIINHLNTIRFMVAGVAISIIFVPTILMIIKFVALKLSKPKTEEKDLGLVI
jgi:hypothetical protein